MCDRLPDRDGRWAAYTPEERSDGNFLRSNVPVGFLFCRMRHTCITFRRQRVHMTDVIPTECRRCGKPFPNNVENRFLIPCDRCRYVTAGTRATRIEMPLEPFREYAPLPASLLGDTADHDETCEAIAGIRQHVLLEVQRHVDESRSSALQWLCWLLGKSDELSERFMASTTLDGSRPFRIAQVVYAMLLRRGTLDFGIETPTVPSSFFQERAYTIVGDVSVLSTNLSLGRKGLYRWSIEGGRLIGERNDKDLALFELIHSLHSNAHRRPVDASVAAEVFDERLVEVQKLAFGHAVQDLFALIDPAGADTGLAGRQDGDLVWIDLARSTPAARSLIEPFTLTGERLQQFEAPFFFDLGPRAKMPRDFHRVVEESADAMWLAYYPFFTALTARRPAGPMAFTTTQLLVNALATADSSRAHMLHCAQRKHGQLAPGVGERIKSLVRSFHASFESSVAQTLASNNLKALSSVSEIGGRALECGEIDVVAAGRLSGGGMILLVCEAKNVDLAVQKDSGYEHLSSTLARACEQLRRKTAWAAEHPGDIARLLGLDVPPTIVAGAIVTRRRVPLPLLERWPGVVPEELDEFAQHLLGAPPSNWRPDIARGIVTLGASL